MKLESFYDYESLYCSICGEVITYDCNSYRYCCMEHYNKKCDEHWEDENDGGCSYFMINDMLDDDDIIYPPVIFPIKCLKKRENI